MNSLRERLGPWLELLRWTKPTGRLILLIPAGWSLWLSPSAPPGLLLLLQIVVGGLAVSGAGCIANDLWDRRFDSRVERTKQRPLARGAIRPAAAFMLLIVLLVLSLAVVLSLDETSQALCLLLSICALPAILLYPSAKRWFAYPQAVLAFCWGFAVLIPWAAAERSLTLQPALIGCWLATVLWTFGFDTVYAMADRRDDAVIGLNSSALSLGSRAVVTVRACYGLTVAALALAAVSAGVHPLFWIFWLGATVLMQLSCRSLNQRNATMASFGLHFRGQVQIGSLLLLGLMLSRGLTG
ncbi:4-hydroxybenzoate polyprenyltransferase [Synechococcus sp. A15-28]|uniref:4-hydroxybenzoate polyprenyltransferase n=1 Tax=Synechococcus sp. A15-28 TaxID=1050638 RepID=UPI0016476A16|nr:4-hydroxybenzoate polyprenyltransferase [Synechococcus sp. A15-28]QNI43053.1 4-hydroxybenzoate polyprenyltransferase [Synechococcus sp. A15-28]